MPKPGKRKLYDQKSEELARHFMQDRPELNTPNNIDSLAKDIQQAVEDWFDGQPE